MKDLNIKINGYEGPLDLLLHLIQQYEMDIYKVPLAEITDQYLAYLNTMKTLQLEVAGEYLVVAATLLAIKSTQLLPVHEEQWEETEEFYEEDPKENLIQQLLEYRRFKYAAEKLKEKEENRQLYYDKMPADLSQYSKEVPLEKNQVTTIDLVLAFHEVLEKQKGPKKKQAKIVGEDVSVSEKVSWLKSNLFVKAKKVPFHSLFETADRNELVTTFLAVLELLKTGIMEAQQEENLQEIYFLPKESLYESAL